MKITLKSAFISALICGAGLGAARSQYTAATPSGPASTGASAAVSYSANAKEDIKKAVAAARVTHQRILIQVGSSGCIWCSRLNKFIAADPEIRRVAATFITIRADFRANAALLLSYGEVPGTPHYFVLDKDGELLASQETGSLEEGQGYDRDMVLDFFKSWELKPARKPASKKKAGPRS